MTQRRCCREAGFAGTNVAAVLGREPRQVEKIDRGIVLGKYFLRDLRESEALRHFARAGVLGT